MRPLLLLFCLLICGCGQKGDLYLPDVGGPENSTTQEEETEETRKNNS